MDKLLAYEILSEILGYLKDDQQSLLQINRICKKLYELSIPLLFKSPQFTTFNKFESFANTLTEQNGTFVRHIDLHMVPHRWDSSKINTLLYALAEKTPNLELLNLDLCSQLTNKALIKITKPLHDLRVLSVDQCEIIGDDAIETLVEQCPYIQELYLGSTHITDNSLNLIAKKLILLTHLHMPGCEYITELGVKTLTTECKTLQFFDIKDCYNVVGTFGMGRGQSAYERLRDLAYDLRALDRNLAHEWMAANGGDNDDNLWVDEDEFDIERSDQEEEEIQDDLPVYME